MTPTALFAADPGLRSGWASWDGEKIRAGTDDPMDLCDRLKSWLTHEWGGSEVVYEAYQITTATAQKSQQHWSLELIGAARWLAYRHGATFDLQKPVDAKRFCPDARLRDLGLWGLADSDHARDALRHLVLRLAKHRLIDLRPLSV